MFCNITKPEAFMVMCESYFPQSFAFLCTTKTVCSPLAFTYNNTQINKGDSSKENKLHAVKRRYVFQASFICLLWVSLCWKSTCKKGVWVGVNRLCNPCYTTCTEIRGGHAQRIKVFNGSNIRCLSFML